MNIVILEDLFAGEAKFSAFQQFQADFGNNVKIYKNKPATDEELLERAIDADIVVVSNLPLGENLLKQMPKLKLISVAFTGVDHIDTKYCKNNNICVCNASGYATQAVAELTIALMLDLYRKITVLDKETKNGNDRKGIFGRQLAEKTIGLIGSGLIALRVAELLKPFNCRFIAVNQSGVLPNNSSEIQLVSINELLSQSDIVSIHAPLTSQTENLINKEKLLLMKSDAILINTARGKVINSDDLAYVLNNNMIAGAATDIYETEPPLPLNHPLLQCKNIITTPHIGYATYEAIEMRTEITFENILLWQQGSPQNVIC